MIPTFPRVYPQRLSPRGARAVLLLAAIASIASISLMGGVSGRADAATAAPVPRDEPRNWQLEALLEPDPGPPSSMIGPAVTINPKRSAVGNRRNGDLGTDTGQVHCYDLVRRAWRQSQLLKDPSGCLTCDFGAALSMDPDRLAVGAPRDCALGFEAGRIHIYGRKGSRWALEATLARPSPAAAELFGHAVAVKGRVLVAGAPRTDLGGGANDSTLYADAGAVEVFEYREQQWVHGASLLPPAPATSGWFGAAVAVEGDLIAVGSFGAPQDGAQVGAVHLYRRNAVTWIFEQSIQPPWPGSAWFGYSVALDDGHLLVGAPRAQAPGSGGATGAAFLYESRDGRFELSATLTAPWIVGGDALGISVALDHEAAFVAATGDDESGEDAGAVYLFSRLGSAFRPAERLIIPGTGEGDHVGAVIAATNGRLIVGRGGNPEVDPRAGEGAAWIFTSPKLSPASRTSPADGSGSSRAPPRRSQSVGR